MAGVSHPTTESNFHSLVVIGKDQCLSKNAERDHLVQILKRFWDNETVGIHKVSEEGEQPIQFLSEIQFNGTRYEVRLPWNDVHLGSNFLNHFRLCFNGLKYLQQKLLKTPSVLQEYNQIIIEQLDRRIIEVITNHNNSGASQVHYLPHHPVVRQDKQTTKVRVVYDGSAKSVESPLSINDCLLTGPNLIPNLFNILIRFRWNIIAVTADIEKAFLMNAIHRDDRDMPIFMVQGPYKGR